MFDIFLKAAKNELLSPGSRAFLKLAKGTITAALISAIVAAYPLIASNTSVDWNNVLHTFIVAFTMAIIAAISKYFTAQSDSVIATTASTQTVQNVVGTSAKTDAVTPAKNDTVTVNMPTMKGGSA